MIDEDRTIQLFGYTSSELAPKSNKKIVVVCEDCGRFRVLKKSSTINRVFPGNLCHRCANGDVDKRKMLSERSTGKGNNNYGKVEPDEQKHKISLSMSGVNNHRFGEHVSDEQKYKISASLQGIKYIDWKGFTDKSRPHITPSENCTQLNKWFAGSNGHHITPDIVVYIPSELHRHLQHNLKTGYNMYEINTLSIQFINGCL